jgi:hypothetical protein
MAAFRPAAWILLSKVSVKAIFGRKRFERAENMTRSGPDGQEGPAPIKLKRILAGATGCPEFCDQVTSERDKVIRDKKRLRSLSPQPLKLDNS